MGEQPKESLDVVIEKIRNMTLAKGIRAKTARQIILEWCLEAARSRPHPASAPTDEQCRICSAAVARAAREDVLDNICHNCAGLADGAEQCNSCYVKSLRGERR